MPVVPGSHLTHGEVIASPPTSLHVKEQWTSISTDAPNWSPGVPPMGRSIIFIRSTWEVISTLASIVDRKSGLTDVMR